MNTDRNHREGRSCHLPFFFVDCGRNPRKDEHSRHSQDNDSSYLHDCDGHRHSCDSRPVGTAKHPGTISSDDRSRSSFIWRLSLRRCILPASTLKRKHLIRHVTIVILLLTTSGCPGRQEPTTTRGTIAIECDEAIFPVMKKQAEDFERSYRDARIIIRPVGARTAMVDFINDSIQVIATARPFNSEELEAITASKIQYHEYLVAFDAVAVILNKENPIKRLRISQLDSILTGTLPRWPSRTGRGNNIEVVLCGLNSSTNEIVSSTILGNKLFAPWASYFDSSSQVVQYVRNSPNAIGIVGLSWLQGVEQAVTVASLGNPNSAPDTTQPVGQFYSPAQANVYRRYYPITTRLYMYNREILRTVGLGFIAYVISAPGQKVFQENGLVPATMPVRLVETTSKQVNPQ